MNDIKIKCDKFPRIDLFVDGVNISDKITSFTLFGEAGSLPLLEVTFLLRGELDIALQGEVRQKCAPC